MTHIKFSNNQTWYGYRISHKNKLNFYMRKALFSLLFAACYSLQGLSWVNVPKNKQLEIELKSSSTSLPDPMSQVLHCKQELIGIIDMLMPHLSFWKNQAALAQLQKSSQQERLALLHHKKLEHAIDTYYYHLGSLETLEKQLKHEEFPRNTSLSNIQNELLELQEKIEYFKKEAHTHAMQHTIPSHISMHKFGYASSAFGALCVALYLYKNKDNIPEFIKSAQQFTHGYIYHPLKEFFLFMFGYTQSHSEQALATMITDYLHANHPDYSPESIHQEAAEAVVKRELSPEFYDECAKEFRNIGQNIAYILFSDFLNSVKKMRSTVGNIWNKKETSNEPIYEAQKGQYLPIKAIKVVFGMIKLKVMDITRPIVPIAIGFAFYKIYGHISSSFKERHFSKPLKRLLVTTEQELNIMQSNNDPYLCTGKMVYFISKIRAFISYIPTNERISFIGDLNELESSSLAAFQKLQTINRMYHTYEFLK